jgi:hypothetical protein
MGNLRRIPIKDAVSKLLQVQITVSTEGFHHNGSHHSGLSPPYIQVPNKLDRPHTPVSSVVAVCLDIQVRVLHAMYKRN